MNLNDLEKIREEKLNDVVSVHLVWTTKPKKEIIESLKHIINKLEGLK